MFSIKEILNVHFEIFSPSHLLKIPHGAYENNTVPNSAIQMTMRNMFSLLYACNHWGYFTSTVPTFLILYI